MAWFILVASGALETVWAVALAESNGLRRLKPTLLFFVSMTISMLGLAYAMTEISVGTAYAVWVGIGATGAVAWSAFTGAERMTVARTGLILLLICSVIGLKVAS
mgnify:CR=1 FL=1